MVSTSGAALSTSEGAAGARHTRRFEWRRGPRNLTTSLVDIDVALTDIVFQRYADAFDASGGRGPSSVADYAIEGVLRPAASAADDAAHPTLVYISGYQESDRLDRDEDIDQRSVCYIATDRRQTAASHSNIYIENYLFRRLVELYASKRINSAKISIVLKVLQDPSGAIDVPTSSHAMLRNAGDRHRQHSRAHLMSVQTSLRAAAQAHPALPAHSQPWGYRMGRRQNHARM